LTTRSPISNLKGRTIAVTGASGYIGDALVKAMAGTELTLIRISRHQDRLAPLAGATRHHDVCGDVSEPAFWRNLFDSFEIDTMFHLAGQTSAYAAKADPGKDFAANVAPMIGILEACESRPVTTAVIFAGAATQVGVTTSGPVDESPADCPDTIYDLHKLVAERHLREAVGRRSVEGGTLRLANVYGPGGQSASDDRGILNRMVRLALDGEAITVFGDGAQIRDYVYLDDVLNAFVVAAARPGELMGRHFLIGSGTPYSIADAFHMVARQVAAATGHEVPVESRPWPDEALPIEFRNFFADVSAFEGATGWRPAVGLQEGIDRTIEAFSGDLQADRRSRRA